MPSGTVVFTHLFVKNRSERTYLNKQETRASGDSPNQI